MSATGPRYDMYGRNGGNPPSLHTASCATSDSPFMWAAPSPTKPADSPYYRLYPPRRSSLTPSQATSVATASSSSSSRSNSPPTYPSRVASAMSAWKDAETSNQLHTSSLTRAMYQPLARDATDAWAKNEDDEPRRMAVKDRPHERERPRRGANTLRSPEYADHDAMKYKSERGILKLVPPTTGFSVKAPQQQVSPQKAAAMAYLRSKQGSPKRGVELPEGTLHVWIYQARHLVFRRLFETMYERHGLRLRVYACSATTKDVGDMYETHRNYGGNMANPRWRRDADDARDNTHGHFGIPLSRSSLRCETELMVEIVCGILVVAHTKVSLPSLFLGSFGTTIEALATQNMQFRPHWFPLSGEDAGLIEMALEFIPTHIVQQHQLQYGINPHDENQQAGNQFEGDAHARQHGGDEVVVYQNQHIRPRSAGNSPIHMDSFDRQRALDYETIERQEHTRRQRYDLQPDQISRERSTTTISTASANSRRSTRFVLPRRSSLSDLDKHDIDEQYRQPSPPSAYRHGHRRSRGYSQEDDDLAIMDVASEFSGYEHHDYGRYDEEAYDMDNHDGTTTSYDDSEYDGMSLSASSSSWASVSSLNDSAVTSQENLMNKQLWDLYRYGISDEAPEEVTAYSVSPRSSSVSISSSVYSRKMSTMSQASNFSIAFSDASEASMISRESSTCASEILTYNDRIQRMEEAIRAARERRAAEEAAAAATAAVAPPEPQAQHQEPRRRQNVHIPAPITTSTPTQSPHKERMIRPPSFSPYGWERRAPLVSPATSEPPVTMENRKGIVLFDLDNIPVKSEWGQTDPALAAYRAKMLAIRRSLPIHMLSGNTGAPLAGGRSGYPPPLVREFSAPQSRFVIGKPVNTNNQNQNHTHGNRIGNWSAKPSHRSGVIDSPQPKRGNYIRSLDEDTLSRRSEARSSKSDESLPGPPSLRRKRSSSLHSISDLLRDQSFRIHNISTDAESKAPSCARPSVASDRKLSYASSSEASSSNPNLMQIVPATSGAPRVRRNSRGGGNLLQINGVVLGVGKFINVGNVPGVIRYIGPTMFAPGQWIGIELVEKKGKHNGTVQNVQYFECAPEHGIFIRAERLDLSAQP